MKSTRGKYRIQAVSEITGIPAATLRAWERRYGLPKPRRTASSYRLYSEYDVDQIRQLQALCAAGMSPAEAARQIRDAETGDAANVSELSAEQIDPYLRARDNILKGVEKFDPRATESAVLRSLHLGSAVTIYDRVIGPAMTAIGDRWHAGQFSTGQEHMATEIIGGVMRNTLRLVQPEGATRSAVLACFAGENHELPLFGVALRMSAWGFRTVMLGARTPPPGLRHAVRELDPDIVGLSVTIAPQPAGGARALVEDYASACGTTPWIVGGRGAPAIREHVERCGGLVLDPTLSLEEARAGVERLLTDARARARRTSTS